MSDHQLMKALQRIDPEKSGVAETSTVPPKQANPPSAATTERLKESERECDVREVYAAGKCSLGEKDATGKMVRSAAGVKNTRLAMHLISEMIALPSFISTPDLGDALFGAVGFLQAMGPENVNEGMLAVQMYGVHNAALRFLKLAFADGQTVEGSESSTRRAANLMRLFMQQTEALAKLKGKTGQQKVTVEHVHVHQGGQAIVGAVETAKADPGRGDDLEEVGKTP